MDETVVLERREDLVSSPVGADLVFLNPESDSYVALDPVGARIWAALDQPRTLGDVLTILETEFEASRERIAADVAPFVDRLVEQRMIRTRPSA